MPVPLLIALKDKLPDGGSLVKKGAAILTCHLETEVVAVLGSGDVMDVACSPVCRSGNRGNLGGLL